MNGALDDGPHVSPPAHDAPPDPERAPDVPRRPGRRRLPKDPAQDVVRALFLDCLARELLWPVDVASRFGVHKSVVSRFQAGLFPFPARKLAELEVFLRDVASGHVVLERSLRRAQIAKTATELVDGALSLLSSLPPALGAQVDAIETLPTSEPVAPLVERALVALAMRRGHGNFTAAGELLHVPRKVLATRWAKLEPSRGAGSVHDGRVIKERTRRERATTELLASIPPVLQSFARDLTDAVPASAGSTLKVAREILRAHALRRGDDAARASRLSEEAARTELAERQRAERPKPPRSHARRARAQDKCAPASLAESIAALFAEVPFVAIPGEVARLLERATPIELTALLERLARKDEEPEPRASETPVFDLAEVERRTIAAALRATGDHRVRAAKLLGISRSALYAKLGSSKPR